MPEKPVLTYRFKEAFWRVFAPFLGFLFLLLLIQGCSGNTASNAPPPFPSVTPNGDLRGESNFAVLMNRFSKGRVTPTPWAGYWWPYASNGIADAASKFETASGKFGASDWELTHHGTGVPGLQQWWGHCNGWAAAATLFNEPVNDVSGFSVADQKALLSEIAMEVQADYFGRRNDDDDPSNPTFQDVSPDQFFLVLTNFVGNGMPLVIDRYTGSQVWNQPIAGYELEAVGPDSDLGTDPSAPNVHRVMTGARVWWLRDDVDGGATTEPFSFIEGTSYDSRLYRFELWLDGPLEFDASGKLVSSGNVILARQGDEVMGGAWRNGGVDIYDDHPDYMWIPHDITPATVFANPYVDVGWVEAHFGHRSR